jgi:hypothetical protein
MAAFTPYHVHNAFGIESKVEEQLQPGITISKPVRITIIFVSWSFFFSNVLFQILPKYAPTQWQQPQQGFTISKQVRRVLLCRYSEF